MTESALTVLSVRGDSRLEVAPDLATLDCSLVVYEREKSAALSAAAQRLDALLADLAGIGGVVRSADGDRLPLTWLARSARSYPEFDHDKGYRRQTGRVIANVSVRLEVRDFTLLTRLDATLARHADLHVNSVRWSVDHDNDAWPQVRATAIEAAIQQARHYASALGGSLVSVDHVADAGLLGGDPHGAQESRSVSFGMRASGGGDDGDAPSLDPEPIELRAVIEARCTASVRPLG
jgi:uncharacterized protein YggE